MGDAVGLTELVVGDRGDRIGLDDRSLRLDGRAHPVAHDLRVPGGPQLAGQPLELVAQRADDVGGEQRLERGQRAAQPPGGHPHLVHGVGGVQAHRQVLRLDLLHLLPDVGEQDLARRRLGRQLRGPCPGLLRRSAGRRARAPASRSWAPPAGRVRGGGRRRPPGGRPSPSASSTSISRHEVAAPAASPRPSVASSRRAVTRSSATSATTCPVASTSRRTVRSVTISATGRSAAPRLRAHTICCKRRRHRPRGPPQRQTHLRAGVRPRRDLQMPAGVVAAGPPAQSQPGRGQPQIGGVEVRRRQPLPHRLALGDRGDLPVLPTRPRSRHQLRQRRQLEAVVSGVLLLDFRVNTDHSSVLRRSPGRRCPRVTLLRAIPSAPAGAPFTAPSPRPRRRPCRRARTGHG